jgi:thiol:disulfide interchange protein
MKNKVYNIQTIAPYLKSSFLAFSLFSINSATASNGINNPTDGYWGITITLLVFVVAGASAALSIAATRQWQQNWKLVAGLPLLGLLAWLLIISISKVLIPGSHELWTLEIFAWAMLNMIYMVTAMTAKRVFAKKEQENSLHS